MGEFVLPDILGRQLFFHPFPYPIIMEDPGGKYAAWAERHLSFEDTRWFGDEPVAMRGHRYAPEPTDTSQVGIPLINWPAPPRPKLNTLWVPSGATRWSRGWFLVRRDQLDFALGPGRSNWVLIDQTGDQHNAFHLYYLGSINITEDVAVVQMVDQRYFLQNATSSSAATTWVDSRGFLHGSVPSIYADEIDADRFAQPDRVSFLRANMNAAVMTDASAASLGAQITLDQGVLIGAGPRLRMRARPFVGTGRTSLPEDRQLIDGSTTFARQVVQHVPRLVYVVFPRYKPDTNIRLTGNTTITKRADDYIAEDQGTPGSRFNNEAKTIFDTAHAEFIPGFGNTSSTVVNFAELDALADAIAASYYARAYQYDFAIHGVAPVEMAATDDYIWYHFGHRPPGDTKQTLGLTDDYVQYTRIASLPLNVGVETMLHQFQYIEPESLTQTFVTDVYCDGDDIVTCTRTVTLPPGTVVGPEECG